jgi:ABC-type multidrug transport system ATPase subunit/ABC-type transport system involved in multi-copper enzyme maturation permease subunit
MDSVQLEVVVQNEEAEENGEQMDFQPTNKSQNNSRAVSRESSSSAFGKVTSRHNSELALEVKWSDITIKFGEKKLLHGVSGSVHGKFLAIMGGSGSGKTTLLNYLARRMQRQTKKEEGVSKLNGAEYSRSTLKQVSGYVVQDDLLFGNLTVEETLLYSAKLRLPADVSDDERKVRVEDAMKRLGLLHCRNTIIGDELKRGVSGGERKRVCVAVELLMRPNVLMLDEPTSGLDSASALSLCQTLKELAESGSCTVICTIHQPQTKIFKLFDELIILNKGHVLYQGPADEIISHYTEAGFPCPPYTNPADHILDVVTSVAGCDEEQIIQNQKTLEEFMTKKRSNKVQAPEDRDLLLNEDDFKEMDKKKWSPPRVKRTPWFQQFCVLSQRAFRDTIRNRTTIIAQVLQNIIVAVLVGTVFYDIGSDQKSMVKRMPVLFFCAINQGVFGALVVINSFPSERKIVLRERAAGSYYVSAYYIAKIAAETLLQFTSPVIFSAIVYWLVGLQYSVAKFFVFASFMVLCSLAATSIALFISAVCRTTTLAVSVLPMALEIARLFGGYFLSPANLPSYFSWLDALSYAKYTYVGVALNELSGLALTCTAAQLTPSGECPGAATIETLGLNKLSIEGCAWILILMIVVFRVAAYLAIRFIKW